MDRRTARLSRRTWKDDLYTTLLSAGRDLEQRADEVRRKLARILRGIAPTVVHVGAQLGHEMREAARTIDAQLYREGKRTSAP